MLGTIESPPAMAILHNSWLGTASISQSHTAPMGNPAPASALLSHLYRTDGSATFNDNGYGIIASVNGPIEVQRRDELPEEAAIDVIVRPAAGVGGM